MDETYLILRCQTDAQTHKRGLKDKRINLSYKRVSILKVILELLKYSLKIFHQNGLFEAIKENPNYPVCRRILHIYRQWLLSRLVPAPIASLSELFCFALAEIFFRPRRESVRRLK